MLLYLPLKEDLASIRTKIQSAFATKQQEANENRYALRTVVWEKIFNVVWHADLLLVVNNVEFKDVEQIY